MIDEVLYQGALLECSHPSITAFSLAVVVSSIWLISYVSKLFAGYSRFPHFTAKDIL